MMPWPTDISHPPDRPHPRTAVRLDL